MNKASSSTFPGSDDRPAIPMPFTGAALLLTVLLVLCLAGISVISLSTAKSNFNSSLRLQQRRDAWYEACNQAQELVAELDRRLALAEQTGREADFSGLKVEQEGDRVSCRVPIDELQELRVELQITPADSSCYYQITAWQLADRTTRQEAKLQLIDHTGGNE